MHYYILLHMVGGHTSAAHAPYRPGFCPQYRMRALGNSSPAFARACAYSSHTADKLMVTCISLFHREHTHTQSVLRPPWRGVRHATPRNACDIARIYWPAGPGPAPARLWSHRRESGGMCVSFRVCVCVCLCAPHAAKCNAHFMQCASICCDE